MLKKNDDASTAPGPTLSRPMFVVAALALAGTSVALLQTLVVPLVADLPALLHTSTADASWVVTSTLLAAAVATPIAGRLGDMYGKRRIILASVSLMAVGSFVCALSDSVGPLIVGRVLQGLSVGVTSLGIGVLRDVMPADKLATAIALMSATLGVGSAFGLPLSAVVADKFDWHVLFWGSGLLGVVGGLLVLLVVPESRLRSGGRFDFLGAVGLAAALVSFLLALSMGADWGWVSAPTLGLIVTAIVILVAWARYELRTPEPLVRLRTMAKGPVLFTNLAGAAFGFSLFALQFIIPQLLQLPTATGYGFGESLLTVGLVLAPQGVVILAASPVSAAISRAKGPKTTLMVGAAVVALGYAINLFMMSQIWQLILVACIVGAGVGLAYGALPLLLTASVPPSETASTQSLNTLMRAIGTSIASALASVILAQMTLTLGGHTFPSEDAFRVVMAIGCAAALASLVLASRLPGPAEQRPSPVGSGSVEVAPS